MSGKYPLATSKLVSRWRHCEVASECTQLQLRVEPRNANRNPVFTAIGIHLLRGSRAVTTSAASTSRIRQQAAIIPLLLRFTLRCDFGRRKNLLSQNCARYHTLTPKEISRCRLPHYSARLQISSSGVALEISKISCHTFPTEFCHRQ